MSAWRIVTLWPVRDVSARGDGGKRRSQGIDEGAKRGVADSFRYEATRPAGRAWRIVSEDRFRKFLGCEVIVI